MKDLQFLRNVSIGQYMAGDSMVHRLHPGLKLGLLLVIVCSALVLPDALSLALCGLMLVAWILVAGLSPREIFRGLLPAWPYLLLTGVLQLLFMPADPQATVLWQIPEQLPFSLIISTDKLTAVGLLYLRFLLLMGSFTLYSATSNTNEISSGTEALLRPLQKSGFPAHETALLVAITFRFIPILAAEAERLAKAQAARGGDIGTHKGGLARRVTSFFPLFVPLFNNALSRAEDLIEAMEAKCYSGSKGRTSLNQHELKLSDIAVLVFLLLLYGSNLILAYSGVYQAVLI